MNYYERKYKIIADEKEMNDILVDYFFVLSFYSDGEFQRALNYFAQQSGYGEVFIWALFQDDFDEWEEPYYEQLGKGYVLMALTRPAVDEDIGFYITFAEFYEHLKKCVDEKAAKRPEKSESLYALLLEVKEGLNL